MKLAILGSTGFLGKEILRESLDKEYQIRTLVRNPEKLGEYRDRVEIIQGNIFNSDNLTETVKETEVVISAVGPPQRNPGKPELYRQPLSRRVRSGSKHERTIRKATL
jgi:hypothetical protein